MNGSKIDSPVETPEKENTMAKTTTPVGTKSDRFRARLAAGDTIAEAAASVGIGYAFAYGIAKRTPDPDFPGKSYATTRAHRRATKAVSVEDGIVTVRIVNSDGEYTGRVMVEMTTGKVTQGK